MGCYVRIINLKGRNIYLYIYCMHTFKSESYMMRIFLTILIMKFNLFDIINQ